DPAISILEEPVGIIGQQHCKQPRNLRRMGVSYIQIPAHENRNAAPVIYGERALVRLAARIAPVNDELAIGPIELGIHIRQTAVRTEPESYRTVSCSAFDAVLNL